MVLKQLWLSSYLALFASASSLSALPPASLCRDREDHSEGLALP